MRRVWVRAAWAITACATAVAAPGALGAERVVLGEEFTANW